VLVSSSQHLELYSSFKGFTVHSQTHPDQTDPKVLKSNLNAYIDALLTDVYLSHKLDARISTLSGGQKRKVSLAIALLGNPKIVILDECTTGMDTDSTHQIWGLLESIKSRGETTIILTTHLMEEAETLGDRIAILSKGKLQALGTGLFLKKKWGVGYRLVVEGEESFVKTIGVGEDSKSVEDPMEKVLEITKKWLPESSIASSTPKTTIIFLNSSASSSSSGDDTVSSCLHNVFHDLRVAQEKGDLNGVDTIGLSQSTLEEVFITLKEMEEEDEEDEGEGKDV
jgi:ABC-type multidrug transport system ATPase subunit